MIRTSTLLCLAAVALSSTVRAHPLQAGSGEPAASRGIPFCQGDALCPCGNDSASGSGEGCLNSTGSGAYLDASGNAWVGFDSLVLTVSQVSPGDYGIFAQNINTVSPAPFYNGLFCLALDGHLGRHYDPPTLQPTIADAAGSGRNLLPLSTTEHLQDTQPGVTVYYQFWYRDHPGHGATCTEGASFSSGLSVTWTAGPVDMGWVRGGAYEMGDHHFYGLARERPVHTVEVPSFWMDTREVSNEDYCVYLNAAHAQGLIQVTGGLVQISGGTRVFCETDDFDASRRLHWDGAVFTVVAGKEDHPATWVSWYGALSYANWRSVRDGLVPCYDVDAGTCDFDASGYRLPTEAEWEYAARGGLHAPAAIYPWGDVINGSMANYRDSGDPYEAPASSPWTSPVGYYDGGQSPAGADTPNGYGLYDVAGNVWEWCWDWFDPDYYQVSPVVEPLGPASGLGRVVRGGSWYDTTWFLRCSFRFNVSPEGRHAEVGFRLLAEAL